MESGKPQFIPHETFTSPQGVVHILQTAKIPFQAFGTDEPAVLAVSMDITERVRAEQRMQQALVTLDATEDGAFIFDAETLRVSYVNEGAVRQVGYSREELLTMTVVQIKPGF